MKQNVYSIFRFNHRRRSYIDDIDESVMIILNALYFNGYWRRQFAENETIESAFFVTPATQVKTAFMTQTKPFFYFESRQLDAKLLRLPYKGRKFAMTVVLPNSKGGLDELIHQMDANTLHQSQYFMDEVEVRVQLPRFKFGHTILLNDVLQKVFLQHKIEYLYTLFKTLFVQLGIAEIFTSQASLPLLARGADAYDKLQVSKILQKTGISVNERGSTAFTATEVLLVNKFGGDTTKEFIANRPFVFLIEDESTGTLLFAGKVSNPADFEL